MEQGRQAGRHVVDKTVDRQRCMGGWMDEWTNGWMEEWLNKWKGRKTERQKNDKQADKIQTDRQTCK